MESLVLKQSIGLLPNVVELDLSLNEEDGKNKLSQSPNDREIHCIIESDSSDDELFDFRFEDNENYTIHVLSSDSEGEAVGESSKTIELNQSIELVESEEEVTEIFTNMQNTSNLTCSITKKTTAVIDSGPRIECNADIDSEPIERVNLISDIENEMEIVNITLSDDHDESILNVERSVISGRMKVGKPSKTTGIDRSEQEMVNILPNSESTSNVTSSVDKNWITDHNQSSTGPRSMVSTVCSSCCVIDELLENGFNRTMEQSKISYERIKEIILQGRPFPNASSAFCTYIESIFNVAQNDFTTFPWLTACMSLEILLCWPCSMVFWECKALQPDSNNEFAVNSLLFHSRLSSHKYAEVQYDSWLKDYTQNKSPKYVSSRCLNTAQLVEIYGKFSRINRQTIQTNMTTPLSKPIIILPEKDFLNIKKTASIHPSKTIIVTDIRKIGKVYKKRCKGVAAPDNKSTSRLTELGNEVEPILDASIGGFNKTVPIKPHKTVTESHKSKGPIMQFEKILMKFQIPESKNTSNETKHDATNVQTAGENVQPHSDVTCEADIHSELDKIASTPTSKTVDRAALSGRSESQKSHQEVSGLASDVSDSIQSDQVMSNNQPESGDACRSNFMTKQCPSPSNISSAQEIVCRSRALDACYKPESRRDNKLEKPSNFHMFCSMSISGIDKYYMDGAGIISHVVVVDKLGKSAQVDVPSHNPTVAVKNDHNYCKSTKACSPSGYFAEDLIVNNFFSSYWSEEQRVQIVKNGGPFPLVYSNSSRRDNENMIHEGNHWLVSLKYDVGVVCWPCLLFGPIWFVMAKDNFLRTKINSHRRTSVHNMSCLAYWVWVDKNIETGPEMRFVLSHELLKCLIDTVCSMQMRINITAVTPGDFLAVLQLVTAHDSSLRRELNNVIRVHNEEEILYNAISAAKGNDALVSHYIQAITESIFKCMRMRIIRELKDADFVCLILSQAKNQPWLSVVFRYVTSDGDVVEQFIEGVRNESTSITSPTLFLKAVGIISEFQCEKKLVGYALDGAILNPMEISTFVSIMNIKYPKAKHFYYRIRDLRSTLLEEVSELTYMKVFSYQVNELMIFLEHNESVVLSLKRVINSESNDWLISLKLSSGLILKINSHYSAFVQLFDGIISHPDDWPSEVVVKASNFLDFLLHFPNRFFIATLSKILCSMECVEQSLTQGFDTIRVAEEISVAITSLKGALDDFPAVFEYTKNTLAVPHHVLLEPEEKHCNHSLYIYQDVLNLAIDFHKTIAAVVHNWSHSECELYYTLQHPLEFELCLDLYLNRLLETYESRWKTEYLMLQLREVRQNDFFEPLRNDPLRMIKYLKSHDLQETMSEYYRFLELILTVPMVTTATSLNTRGVDRAAAYIAVNASFNTSGWIWINKDLLTTMKLEEHFYTNLPGYNELKDARIGQSLSELHKSETQNIMTTTSTSSMN